MEAVAEKDPREGLGEAIDAFVEWMEERGIKGTDAELMELAKAGGVHRAAIYRWRSGDHDCRNALVARAIRDAIKTRQKKLT